MKLSEHFTLEEAVYSEMAIRHNLDNMPKPIVISTMVQAAKKLEMVRAALGQPIIVNSWYRSELVNEAIGGSPTSAHCSGWAIDIRVSGMTALELCQFIAGMKIGFDQIIHEYGSWCHVSFDNRNRGMLLTKFTGAYKPGLLTKSQYESQ